jgi:RHS repeat-associated protein
MPLASTWLDLVVGVDLHLEVVPGAPLPIPFPHPFVGIVGDPLGYLVGEMVGAMVSQILTGEPPPTGPVIIGGRMATVTGDDVEMPVPHIVIPPGVSWALPVKPSNDALLLVGSQTVQVTGHPAVRAGEIAFSCSDPVRLPSSQIVPTSAGPPTLIGGPPGFDASLLWELVKGRALRNKWTAGKLHALVDGIVPKKFRRLRNLVHASVCFFTGHPVNVANGCVSTDAADLDLPGPIPVRFGRKYDTNWCDRDSAIGHGWSHAYDQRIWIEPGCVVVQLEDGRELEFDTESKPDRAMRRGDAVFHPVERLTLRAKGELRWTLEDADGVVREFGPIEGERPEDAARGLARLVRIRDRRGYEVRFAYDERARLSTIVDAAGRVVQLEYGGHGRLRYLWVPTPDGQARRQHAEYLYSDDGDLVEVRDALGKPTRMVYEQHLLVQETDRTGLSFYFQYEGWGPYGKCVRTWGDGGIYDHLIAYDLRGRRTIVTNSLGEDTVYQMDGMGMVVGILQPNGSELKYEYDEALRLVAEIDPLGHATRYGYDARGNRVEEIGPDGAVTRTRFDERDQAVERETPIGGVWKWRYDDMGQLVAETDPLGHVTRYEHEGRRLAAVVGAAGERTALTWNASHELVGVRAPNGAESRWRYDALGRMVEATDPRGNVQRRTYDALGRVVRVDEPDGNVRMLAYDGEGNVVRAADRLRDVRMTYEGRGWLASRTIGGTTARFQHDTEGQLVGVVNEKGHAYRFELDPAGEVRAEIDFDETRRIYERDAAGRVTRVLRPGVGKTSRYERDAAGRVIGVEHGDGSVERYVYRADGVLLEAHNDTCVVRFERDLLGRVVREEQGEHWVASQYDHRGLRIGMESSKGSKQTIERDVMGDVARVAYREGARRWEVRFGRDVMGLEVDRQLPGGARSYWWRDRLGRPSRHFVGKDEQAYRLRGYAWDVDERLVGIEEQGYGEVRYQHDARGYLVSATHPDGRVELRVPDEVGNLFRTAERGDREYGRAGQLLKASTPEGVRTYEYDAEGNLARRVDPDRGEWRYQWNDAGRLVQVDLPDGRAVAFEYDALARRVSKSFDGVKTRWVWDGDNPLHEWTEPGEAPRRKRSAAEEARWAWLERTEEELRRLGDGAARMERLLERDEGFERVHAEFRARARAGTNASGPGEAITWLFEPESFSPLARVRAQGVEAIVTDQVGAPLSVVDEGGGSVWQGWIDTWGHAEGDGDPVPWRFAGQYEDAETGLCYNRFRYYEPWLGRYASVDPFRGCLEEGFYGYVPDPNRWVDPLGLAKAKGRGGEGCGQLDPDKPAKEILPGSLRPKFPGQHLDKSLNEIRKALKNTRGPEKKTLQTAKKLLQEAERLLEELGSGSGRSVVRGRR